jgi:hypothetical protein
MACPDLYRDCLTFFERDCILIHYFGYTRCVRSPVTASDTTVLYLKKMYVKEIRNNDKYGCFTNINISHCDKRHTQRRILIRQHVSTNYCHLWGRGGAVGLDTALQTGRSRVRFPIMNFSLT